MRMAQTAFYLKSLRSFLLRSNQPHATGTTKTIKQSDGSRTIIFTEGDWYMDDNFFAGVGGRSKEFLLTQ